jgi:molecular chaperone DnaK (HSP70)
MWTKLQLDPINEGELVKIVREVSTSTENTNKQPVEIIADFLAQIKAHLIKNLDQKYGKVLWRGLVITLVVTVPAVWTDVAKARTLEAVDKAGFNTPEFPQLKSILMTTEPEAAAIYTIKSLRGMQAHNT